MRWSGVVEVVVVVEVVDWRGTRARNRALSAQVGVGTWALGSTGRGLQDRWLTQEDLAAGKSGRTIHVQNNAFWQMRNPEGRWMERLGWATAPMTKPGSSPTTFPAPTIQLHSKTINACHSSRYNHSLTTPSNAAFRHLSSLRRQCSK